MSFAKPCSASSVQPDLTIAIGSARKVFGTRPPSVTAAHSAKNRMKKSSPRAERRPGLTSRSGFKRGRSLDERRVGQRAHVRELLDRADLEQQVGRFLAELRVLAAEELLVRGAILPAQV